MRCCKLLLSRPCSLGTRPPLERLQLASWQGSPEQVARCLCSQHSRQHELALTHAPSALQVSKARDHVESGVGELIKAKKLQKSTRKWMCCALVVLLIIIAVIVVVAIRPWR